MANFVKAKAGLSILSLSVLILIPLLESNFNAPVTIKRWSKLSWDDFQGLIQPFSRYEAAISSTIYLEYDSAKQTYHAYAGQNNVRSWAKRTTKYPDYALNHEQYHFNISEIHARMLNRYIADYPDGSEYLYRLRLGSVRIDLNDMQDAYDAQTDHSRRFDRQRRWEFKIDSLLVLDSGWVTDKFSGAQAFLPAKYVLSKGIAEKNTRYRRYEWDKYAMSFTLTSFQNELYDDSTIDRIVANKRKGIDTVKSVTITRNEGSTKALIVTKDSSHYTLYSMWFYNRSYLFNASAQYPNRTADSTGYYQIINSYLNSFSVVSTDRVWLDELKKMPAPSALSFQKKTERPKNNSSQFCLFTRYEEEKPGFYRMPIVRDDGAILIPFDYLVDGDSLHHADLLSFNSEIYSFTPNNDGQVYFIPSDKVPNDPYNIHFGYTLKKDSVNECYIFHHHSLQVAGKEEGVQR